MSSENDDQIGARFLGIPIPASAKALELGVHGLGVKEIREIAQQSISRGLSVEIRHLDNCDVLKVRDDDRHELTMFASPDSLAIDDLEGERVPLEVGAGGSADLASKIAEGRSVLAEHYHGGEDERIEQMQGWFDDLETSITKPSAEVQLQGECDQSLAHASTVAGLYDTPEEIDAGLAALGGGQ